MLQHVGAFRLFPFQNLAIHGHKSCPQQSLQGRSAKAVYPEGSEGMF